MPSKAALARTLLHAILFGFAFTAISQSSPPPTSEKTKQVEALVNKSAAPIEGKGKAAFTE